MGSQYKWDFRIIWTHLDVFLEGVKVTLWITFLAIIIGTALGILLAVARKSRFSLARGIASLYIDCFRAIPVLVVMIWMFYCLPGFVNSFLQTIFRSHLIVRVSPVTAAVTGLAIYLSAMLGDIIRAGIDGVPKGQQEVGTTLGMGWWCVQRRIVLPQALRLMIPAVMGQYAGTLLLSSLASVISVEELLHRAQNLITNRYHSLEIYTAVALTYLLIALPATILSKRLEISHKKARRPKKRIGPVSASEAVHVRRSTINLFAEHISYETAEGMKILDDIDCVLKPGKVLGIIGPSGAGKTTLIRVLAGLTRATSGKVRISGNGGVLNPGDAGLVFQDLHLWPHKTALENVTEALITVRGMPFAEANGVGMGWLHRFGLENRATAFPGTLSGGEAQRLAIARALAVQPSVLLFDEITSSLDPQLVGEVLGILKALAEEGATMVMVSHHMKSIYELSDQVLFIQDGKTIDIGPPGEVFSGRKKEVGQFLKKHLYWEGPK
jgi:polar amino acid transport system permease protein